MRYVGIAALSAGVLLLEITLTRIYSVTQGYHFAFLAVSLGLLGFGSSGTVLFLWPNLWRKHARRTLSLAAALFAVTAVGAFWAVNIIPFDAYRLVFEPVMLLHMAFFYLTPLVPFFFAGLALGGAISASPSQTGGLYGASLVGSGMGALLSLGGPASLGPDAAVGTVALLGLAAWLAFARPARPWPLATGGSAAIALGAALWVAAHVVSLDISPHKALPQLLRQEGAQLDRTTWNAFSRVDVVEAASLHQAPGLSFQYTGALPKQLALTIDGDNATTIAQVRAEDARFTEFLPQASVYHLLDRPRVLVIDAGGGLDILTALHHGARHVTALVSNPLEAEVLRNRFLPGLGERERSRVEIHGVNPRSYLARNDESFDLVVVALRNGFQPVSAGAYSLRENHKYTVEAFQAYLHQLAPNGLAVATRWVQAPPSEELRAAAALIRAFENEGLRPVFKRLAALRTLETITFVAKKAPLASSELEVIRDFSRSRRIDLAYGPNVQPAEVNRYFKLQEPVYFTSIHRLLDPQSRDALFASYEFNVLPITDERPYFFHFFRWKHLPDILRQFGKRFLPFGGAGFLVVLGFLVLSLLVSTVLILGPLAIGRKRLSRERAIEAIASDRVCARSPDMGAQGPNGVKRIRVAGIIYFSALGLGFLWIEIPLMQRLILLLDHPTYSFGIVLFSVLASSGLGSLASSRLHRYRSALILLLAALAGAFAYSSLPPEDLVLGLPLSARIAVVIGAIAPLSFLMGIPFPAGISALHLRRSPLIPWAWGVNGYASVVGSVLAAVISLSWGFSEVLLLAGIMYFAAWVVYQWLLRGPAPAGDG